MATLDSAFRVQALSLGDLIGIFYDQLDPTTGGGFEAPIGSFLIQTDGSGFWWKKTGAGNTAWTLIPENFGDVSGPESSTDNAIARFDGTTGRLVQNSSATIDDGGNIIGSSIYTTGAGVFDSASYVVDLSGSNNTVKYPITLTGAASGTPSTGIGTGILFRTQTGASVYKEGSAIVSVSTNVGSGTESFDMVFTNMLSGATRTEKFRISSLGELLPANIHNNGGSGNASNQSISSGTWTPNLTQVANIGTGGISVSGSYFKYLRVGNIVTFSGVVTVDPETSDTITRFNYDLPIYSTFGHSSNLTGFTGSGNWAAGATGHSFADVNTDSGSAYFIPTGASTSNVQIIGQYIIQ